MQLRIADCDGGRITVSATDPRTLKRLFSIREDEIEDAVQASAIRFVSEVRKRAPVYNGPAKKGVVRGALRRGIVASNRREPRAPAGRIIWDVWMDPGMNDIFQRPLPNGKHAYYPASMEYGFRLRNGQTAVGHYFMRFSARVYYSKFSADMEAVIRKYTMQRAPELYGDPNWRGNDF